MITRLEQDLATIGVSLGADPTLSEKSWSAVQAISAIAGHLAFGAIVDTTTTPYVTYDEAHLPASIACGHIVNATVIYYNDDPYAAHSLTCVIEFIDPDGLSRGKATATQSVGAGGHLTAGTTAITLDKAGSWAVHAVLSG
jgi:hypothetical protein